MTKQETYLPFSGWHRPQSHRCYSLSDASFHTLNRPQGPPTVMSYLILLGSGLEGQYGLYLPENPSWGTLSHCTLASGPPLPVSLTPP